MGRGLASVIDLLFPLTTMNFQAPIVFLAPVALLFLWMVRKPRTGGIVFPSKSLLADLPRSLRQQLRGPVLGTLAVCAVVAMTIAAARPQRVRIHSGSEANRNIMLAIDVSPSMGAQDFSSMVGRTSRLKAVKNVVAQFISERKDDRLGLVVFGGAAFLQSPLTTDHALVRELVERLQVGMAGEGTAVGDGLGVALKRVQALPAQSASVILLTDGVSNAGQVNPIKAAKVAQDLGIKVHTVGIGSEREVTVSQPGNIFSNVMQRVVEFDEKTLKEIAQLTGGTYFSASDVSGLERVYQEIDRLERSEENVQDRILAEELFVPYAVAALVSYCLYVLLALTVFMKVPE